MYTTDAPEVQASTLPGPVSYTHLDVYKRQDHQQNARIAVDLVDRELRFARWVEIPREGEIRYKLKDDPRQEDMQYYRRFRLSGEQLLMEEIEGGKIHACNVAALGIGGLSFSLGDCNNVHVAVAAGGAGDRVALQSSVSPRNIARCGAARAERLSLIHI